MPSLVGSEMCIRDRCRRWHSSRWHIANFERHRQHYPWLNGRKHHDRQWQIDACLVDNSAFRTAQQHLGNGYGGWIRHKRHDQLLHHKPIRSLLFFQLNRQLYAQFCSIEQHISQLRLGSWAVGTVAFLNTNGSTAYYNSAITIDGASVTPKWINGATPSSGYANSVDTYTYTIIKTASATYTVLATLAKFA